MSSLRNSSQKDVVCVILVGAITLLDSITEVAMWVEKEQVDSFTREYDCSSDKEKLLSDKEIQYHAIYKVRLISSYSLAP